MALSLIYLAENTGTHTAMGRAKTPPPEDEREVKKKRITGQKTKKGKKFNGLFFSPGVVVSI